MIQVKNITKKYTTERGFLRVLEGISMEIPEGKFIAILGPSGCGKTTLLHILAGFSLPSSGEILVNGIPVRTPGKDRVMIFQNESIFPWLTVEENVRFGLRNLYSDETLIREKTQFFLRLVHLRDFAHYYPKQLSGGMRKRVDIARAFAINPPIILADEPFASLDSKTKTDLQLQIMDLWSTKKNTIVFVTHDIEEAIFLSDTIYLLSPRPGKVKEVIPVPFARPRSIDLVTAHEFQAMRKSIIEKLFYEQYAA